MLPLITLVRSSVLLHAQLAQTRRSQNELPVFVCARSVVATRLTKANATKALLEMLHRTPTRSCHRLLAELLLKQSAVYRGVCAAAAPGLPVLLGLRYGQARAAWVQALAGPRAGKRTAGRVWTRLRDASDGGPAVASSNEARLGGNLWDMVTIKSLS
eukprot:3974334-Pleurochrysis_carterae.AAC.1